MSADSNLNLGGNADLIRPKHDRNIMLGIFYLHKKSRQKPELLAVFYVLEQKECF